MAELSSDIYKYFKAQIKTVPQKEEVDIFRKLSTRFQTLQREKSASGILEL